MTPPVNELHTELRKMPVDRGIEHVRKLIVEYGHDAVKRDPGVYAWIMENASVLGPTARTGGLGGDGKR